MNTRLVPDSGNILFLIAMTALTLVASPGSAATLVAGLLDEVAVVVDQAVDEGYLLPTDGDILMMDAALDAMVFPN